MITWLDETLRFPPLETAEPDGLLAAGGDLSPERILCAYRQGIFPWFSAGQPVLWWSPDPRMVVFPSNFSPKRSLLKALRKGAYSVKLDSAFESVITACANTPRDGQSGTWITPEMRSAYIALHQQGYAHSVETWIDGVLVGGLYGLSIGHMFYGESMFSHRTDASKIAFAHLVRHLNNHQYGLLDCQVYTDHLHSLGAKEIPRKTFIEHLQALTAQTLPSPLAIWNENAAQGDW